MGLREGRANLTKLTLPQDNSLVGKRVDQLDLPVNTALVTLLRGDQVLVPRPDDVFRAGDELLLIADSALPDAVITSPRRPDRTGY
jgi:trk system potassium uptake protein TrkA